MFQCFGKDAFAEEKRLIGLRRMIWRYFVMLIGEGLSGSGSSRRSVLHCL